MKNKIIFLCTLLGLIISCQNPQNKQDKDHEAEINTTLLDQQISLEVAQELISSETEIDSKNYDSAIMFLDIRDFTAFSDSREPEEVVLKGIEKNVEIQILV